MRLVKATDYLQSVLSLRNVLRILRLSPSRYHSWLRAEQPCALTTSQALGRQRLLT